MTIGTPAIDEWLALIGLCSQQAPRLPHPTPPSLPQYTSPTAQRSHHRSMYFNRHIRYE